MGNLLSQTDAMQNTTSYAYNDRNECVSQTDPDGDVTKFTYDLAGNMLSTTDPDGNETAWTYDALNRVSTRKSGPGGPGRFPARGSHRPERAQLTHSVPQVIHWLGWKPEWSTVLNTCRSLSRHE